MPAEDVAYWQNQVLARVAREEHTSFLQTEETRMTTASTAFVSAIDLTNFVLHEDTLSEMQARLRGMVGFSDAELSGLRVERILRATHKGTNKTFERFQKFFKSHFINPDDSRKERIAETKSRQKTAREKRMAEIRRIL